MALVIPFVPSIAFYRVATTINSTQYIFDVRWNTRDSAWYFDVLEEDETPIVRGVKVVLGCLLGRNTDHPLFRQGVIVAADLSDSGRDAGFDDFGTRVQVMRLELNEVFQLRITTTFPRKP